MKREGRQHGMVRTYMILPSPWNPRPKSKVINEFESPPTAGLFTKVSRKPTNHSKFTGKCGNPRCVPASKSKDKIKGTHKLKACGDAIDKGYRLNYAGISSTRILHGMSSNYFDNVIDDDDDHVDDDAYNVHDDAGSMSLCDVEFVWDQVEEDEGWCVV